MARTAPTARSGDVQKSFWLRRTLATRLRAVVKARRAAEPGFNERRALEVAIRRFVEHEERAFGIGDKRTTADVADQLVETASELRARIGSSDGGTGVA